ncbi:MAG: prepilin-type N-terminal cleavage/methylation domain-containing protein [Candidatus Omnitrophica bacterium]|nr:prepilin-type N-terminal cleavage/methylation domain-containing protein [Candidatus Omnitrophota bacterium]
MKKGFTLLELIIVIVILGILATLGYTQYTKIVERSRGAEAVANFSKMRKNAINYYLENNTFVGIASADLGIGSDVPSGCASSNYFNYGFQGAGATQVTIYAVRCTASGKTPNWTGNRYVIEHFVNSNSADTIGCWDYVLSQWVGWCVP